MKKKKKNIWWKNSLKQSTSKLLWQPTSLLFIRCHGNLPVLRYSRFVSASRTGTWFPGDRCCSPTHPGRPPERPSTIRTRNKSKYWLIYRPLTAHWSALLIRVRANSLFSWRSETKSIKFLRWLCMKSGKFVLKKIPFIDHGKTVRWCKFMKCGSYWFGWSNAIR